MELYRAARLQGLFLSGLLLALTGLLGPAAAAAQSDTTAAPPQEERRLAPVHSPRGALWRAAAVPGWGQVYNRQFYKVPLVYLGLGGITAATLHLNSQYRFYRHAYLYGAWQALSDQGRDPDNRFEEFQKYRSAYEELTARYGAISTEQLRSVRDSYRRNRDLSYLGIGLFYGLSILDAYVNAHLLDFDVGEDLSVRVLPLPEGLAATVRLEL